MSDEKGAQAPAPAGNELEKVETTVDVPLAGKKDEAVDIEEALSKVCIGKAWVFRYGIWLLTVVSASRS